MPKCWICLMPRMRTERYLDLYQNLLLLRVHLGAFVEHQYLRLPRAEDKVFVRNAVSICVWLACHRCQACCTQIDIAFATKSILPTFPDDFSSQTNRLTTSFKLSKHFKWLFQKQCFAIQKEISDTRRWSHHWFTTAL